MGHYSNGAKKRSSYRRRTEGSVWDRQRRLKEGASQKDYPSKDGGKKQQKEKYRYQPEAES